MDHDSAVRVVAASFGCLSPDAMDELMDLLMVTHEEAVKQFDQSENGRRFHALVASIKSDLPPEGHG